MRTPTRRALLAGVAVAAAAGCAMPAAARGLIASPRRAPREVVSFHMDQPFLDPTGRGKPYRPAAGAAIRLPEAVFLNQPYL